PEGYRRIVARGLPGHQRKATFTALPDGTYTWSVQVIDQDFEGGPFADARSFAYQNPVPVVRDSLFPPQFLDNTASAESWIEVLTDTLIDEVTVHYKGIASANWKTETLTGQNLRYTFAVNTSKADNDELGVEYFYEVKGLYGFSAVTDTHYTYRFYADGIVVQGLRYGSRASAYNLVAIPLTLDNPLVSAVVEDDFGRYSIWRWRMWSYINNGQATQKEKDRLEEYGKSFTKVDPGLGYWLITRKERTFNTGPGLVVEANDADPYVISLKKGWNLIGNPFPFNLSWQDVVAANSSSVTDLLGQPDVYGNNGYESRNTIDRLRGAFVFADENAEVRIPVRKNLSVNRFDDPDVLPAATGSIADSYWQLPLILRSGDLIYPLAAIGMHPEASESKDRFDAITPPRPDEYLEINFPHPEHFAGVFTRDIVTTANGAVWDFEVESNLNDREIRLQWESAAASDPQRRLYLLDIDQVRLVDMSQVNEYLSYSEEPKRHFRIIMGNEGYVRSQLTAAAAALGEPYPNPAETEVWLPLLLPPAADMYEVTFDLLDLSGKEAGSLGTHTLKEGYHEVKATLSGFAPGMYLCRMLVQNGSLSETSYRRLIVR
ncbi:MAG: T9SS C-terminal target domain-containing protein, partial [Bacteroidetes bacterium]